MRRFIFPIILLSQMGLAKDKDWAGLLDILATRCRPAAGSKWEGEIVDIKHMRPWLLELKDKLKKQEMESGVGLNKKLEAARLVALSAKKEAAEFKRKFEALQAEFTAFKKLMQSNIKKATVDLNKKLKLLGK